MFVKKLETIMYATINGIFENGILLMLETPPTAKKSKVVITFMEELETLPKPTKRKLGGLEGKVSIPDDFNEPLDDLKEHMF